jgi:predicted neuraminidase
MGIDKQKVAGLSSSMITCHEEKEMNISEPLHRRTFLVKSALAAGALPLIAGELQGEKLAAFSLNDGSTATAPRIVARSIIFKAPSKDPYELKNLHGFNHATSVVTLPDGRLLAAWFSGPFEASVHQVILASYSSDKGKTWSAAKVLQDTPRKSDFDPAFIVDGKRLWFFYSVGRWNRYPFVGDEKNEVGAVSFKVYHRYSDDSGRTWSEQELVLEKLGVGCRSNGIKLSTGELLLPLHGFLSGVAGVLKSADGGKTWARFGEIKTATVAHEPSIAELPSGEIMMVLRTGDGVLWQTFSKDKGETWLPAEKTDLVAARTSHNIFRLSDGRIVLTHNAAKSVRTPLTTRVSADGGKTWGESVVIAEVPVPGPNDEVWGRQVSYPSVTALDARTILVVWGELYLSATEQYGDIHSATVVV